MDLWTRVTTLQVKCIAFQWLPWHSMIGCNTTWLDKMCTQYTSVKLRDCPGNPWLAVIPRDLIDCVCILPRGSDVLALQYLIGCNNTWLHMHSYAFRHKAFRFCWRCTVDFYSSLDRGLVFPRAVLAIRQRKPRVLQPVRNNCSTLQPSTVRLVLFSDVKTAILYVNNNCVKVARKTLTFVIRVPLNGNFLCVKFYIEFVFPSLLSAINLCRS